MIGRQFEILSSQPALIAHQRYAHAKQFKRANRALRTIRTYLGRVTRDIVRKIQGEAELESVFAHPAAWRKGAVLSLLGVRVGRP